MKTFVIYHRSDLDGFCSGAIAKHHLCNNLSINSDDVEMIGWNYGDEVPEIPNGSNVIMTDISFPLDNMLLLALYCNLEWIDHHKTAMDDSKKAGYNLCAGLRKVGDSASLLAWRYFFPDAKIPDIVYWVDRYDVWKKTNEKGEDDWNEVMTMQHGLRFHMKNPCCHFDYIPWAMMLDGNSSYADEKLSIIRKDGFVVAESEKRTNQIRCSKAFDLVFEGHKFAAINNTLAGSAVLESYARPDHDGILVFSYNGKTGMWEVSMYGNEKSSQEVDLSIIAKKYGGGGHARSCGFRVNDISIILSKK